MKLEFLEQSDYNENLGAYSVYLSAKFNLPEIDDNTSSIEVLVNKSGKPFDAILLDSGFVNSEYKLTETEKQSVYNFLEDLKVFYIVEF